MISRKIVVVGMGYVGLPLAVKFALAGHDVVGLNRSRRKIELINQGITLIKNEPRLGSLLKTAVTRRKLTASSDFSLCRGAAAVFVCVETPYDAKRGRPNRASLRTALRAIGPHLSRGMLVVVESTLAPRTMETFVAPLLERSSGLTAGKDLLLAHCPERVMPGKLLANIGHLDRVIGGIDARSARAAARLYRSIGRGRLLTTDCLTAEIVKTGENAYRDVQIAFANEMALLCEHMGVEARTVRALINSCPYRHMHLAGAGVGGHCLPKDSLLLASSVKGRFTPRLILTARRVNADMPGHVLRLLRSAFRARGENVRGKKLCLLGLAYLENAGDTRNSPAYAVIDGWKRQGGTCVVHDPLADDETVRPERDLERAVRNADAVALVTAHREYRFLNSAAGLAKLKSLMRTPILVDGRDVIDRRKAAASGFSYLGVGKAGANAGSPGR